MYQGYGQKTMRSDVKRQFNDALNSTYSSIRKQLTESSSDPIYRKMQVECEESSEYQKGGKVVDRKIACTTEANLRSRREKIVTGLKGDFYALDTDTISWKPRLLSVPSKEYPDIDSAVCKIKSNAGGYVIKLTEPGEYVMSREICDSVDDLRIIGDENPFVGVSYVQRCALTSREDPNITIPPVNNRSYSPCTNCAGMYNNPCGTNCGNRSSICNSCNPISTSTFGTGPFDISIQNHNTLVVTSALGGNHNDPDFSHIPEGTRMLIFTDSWISNPENVRSYARAEASGSVVIARVAHGGGNRIVFETPTTGHGLSTNIQSGGGKGINAGSGFAFLPNITINIRRGEFNISALKYLQIKGVEINAVSPLLYLNSPAGVIDVGNCHIRNNICYRGRYLLKSPNVYTGLALLWPASTGEAYCQSFIGPRAHLQALSCVGLWHSCIFVYNAIGIEAAHGAVLDLSNSWIMACCTGARATVGSNITLTGAVLCDNTYAIVATYQSQFGAVTPQIIGIGDNQITAGPWFINNYMMMLAYYQSFIIMPITGGYDNEIPFNIDGKAYTTMESNPIGNINQLGSMIIISNNPFAPNNQTLNCDPTSPTFREDMLGTIDGADTWGVTTRSFIEENYKDRLGLSARETTDKLANRST